MKNMILGLLVALSMVACDTTDSEIEFDFRGRMIVFQQGTGDTVQFVPTISIATNSMNHKLADVDIYSPVSALTPFLNMTRYNDYSFVSTLDTMNRLQDIATTYFVKATSVLGNIAQKEITFSVSDTLIMGEMICSDLQYISGKLSVKMKKVSKALQYGFSICPAVKNASGVEEYHFVNMEYYKGIVLYVEGDEIVYEIGVMLHSGQKYKICPIAFNSGLLMEGPARIWDGYSLN